MDTPIAKIIILGIVAVLLVAAIAYGSGMFNSAKTQGNDGMVQLNSQLGDFSTAIFNDYDQKTVSGTMVTSAYNQLKGRPYGVIVKTCKGDWVNYNAVLSPFKTTNPLPLSSVPFSGLTLNATTKQFTSVVSYIDKDSAASAISYVLDGTGDQQVVRYNQVTTDMYKNGRPNYVSSTATFNSFLIRDAGDDIVGVVFVQQGKHV